MMKLKSMQAMCNDKVTIHTEDGREYPDVRAVVDRGTVIHFDTQIPVTVGAHVTRRTPAGVLERWVVEDPGLMQSDDGAFYNMKVRRTDALPQVPAVGQTTIYNVTGPNARFNNNSNDTSVNIVNQTPTELFNALTETLENALVNSPDRTELVRLAGAMEKDVGKATYAQRYAEFMSLAAKHVEIVKPFLPALLQLLTG
jgi:hypothetical protein